MSKLRALLPGLGNARRRGPSIDGDPMRVAIVGAGKFAARTWYPLMASLDRVEIVAACARSEDRVRPLAAAHGIPSVHTDLTSLLEGARPEAVIAVLPPAAVFPVAREVLARGVALFVEKPPGLSVLETRELAAAAKNAGVATMVGFNRRHCAVVREALARLGGPDNVQSVLVEFHKDRPAGGAGDDLVTDIIHSVDLLRALGGEIEEVVSIGGARSKQGLESPAYHALLRYRSGATGALAAFRKGGLRSERIEIHASGLSAEVLPPDRAVVSAAGAKRAETLRGRIIAGSSDVLDTYGFADEIRIFLEAVRGGPRPSCDLEDAVSTMELVESIRESARERTLALSPVNSVDARSTSVAAEPVPARPGPGRASPAHGDRPKVALLLAPAIEELILPKEVREELESFAEILEAPDQLGRRAAARLLGSAEGAITSWKSPKLTPAMAAASPRLRVIAHAAGSVKRFIDASFFERGIAVTNAAAAIAPSVGEMALALTLAGLRALPRYDRAVRGGDFRKESPAPRDSFGLFGRTVGLLGFGRTAREFLRLLEPFGCEVLVFDPRIDAEAVRAAGARGAGLEELLRRSDIVSLHAAYTPSTHHLINAERIGWMKPGALLVNTARGPLVDETALVRRLEEETLVAALDVTVVEPLPAGSRLAGLSNVILTPHISGPTRDRLPELGRMAVEDLRLFFAGERPRNLVTVQMLATMA